jgi:superfamily II DNA or RNA helicase
MSQILRPYQQEAVHAVFDAIEDGYTRILYTLATGCGKCLAKDTPVMLFSGDVQPVQCIKAGDNLMGPDSKPRRVLSTCTGREMLYRVTPVKGEPYVVNESHILSLKMTPQGVDHTRKQPGGTLINISVKDYLAETKTFRHCAKSWKPPFIFFPDSLKIQDATIEPYFLGLWLGDGTSQSPAITTADQEVIDWLYVFARREGLHIREQQAGGCSKTYFLVCDSRGPNTNSLWNMFHAYNLVGNKHVPHRFKTGSIAVRLQLLAGLIDSDGHRREGGGYELVFKVKQLADDVVFLARSLGFAAYVKECQKTCTNNGMTGTYYRISVNGHCDRIPVLISRKKASKRQQIKNVLMTGIKVEPMGEGQYFGFEIDGDGLFLLGDFTVTHNTTIMAELVQKFVEYHNFKVLVLAHRRELISQAYERIKDHCNFDEYQIGIELAETKASHSNLVVIGSVFTVINKGRLPNWKPNVIITDESHRGAAKSYISIFERFGVRDNSCISIGCTATAKRTDKKSLYAFGTDDQPVTLYDKKQKKRIPADPNTSVFEKLCYEFSILDAIEDGWLVPIVAHAVQTETDLSDVETDTDGDFKEGQLARAVDNLDRTMLAISAWKQKAENRPTIVFCAGVEHAYHSAELWRQAGYTAQALGGEEASDSWKRAQMLSDFKSGKLQIICNCGLFTEGTDLPTASCIVHLRPTKSWNLYVQMSGRATRVLPGILDDIQEAGRKDERIRAIADSHKKDCLIIDLVDICANNDLCAAPAILDLPADLDLEGESLTDAKKLLDEFEEVRDRVIGECPKTYRELKARLQEVQLLERSGAKSVQDWKTTPEGYRFARVPVGYKADLKPDEEGWRLTVASASGGVLYDKVGHPRGEFREYLDRASAQVGRIIDTHRAETPKGTLDKLSPGQTRCLLANRHTYQQIDAMPVGYAKKLIAEYMLAWKARTAQQEDAA